MLLLAKIVWRKQHCILEDVPNIHHRLYPWPSDPVGAAQNLLGTGREGVKSNMMTHRTGPRCWCARDYREVEVSAPLRGSGNPPGGNRVPHIFPQNFAPRV